MSSKAKFSAASPRKSPPNATTSFMSPPIRPSNSIRQAANRATSLSTKNNLPGSCRCAMPIEAPPKLLVSNRLALWLAADVGHMTDAKHRVVAWPDILYGDNRSAEDATQIDEDARPTLVPQCNQRSSCRPVQRPVRFSSDHAAGNNRRSNGFDGLPVCGNRLRQKPSLGWPNSQLRRSAWPRSKRISEQHGASRRIANWRTTVGRRI